MKNYLPFTYDKKNSVDKKKSTNPKILLIAYSKEMRQFIKSELYTKFDMIEANDGIEGWEYMQNNLIDIVISDVMMTEVDGIQFCKKIKNNINTCHIPFIIITTKSSLVDLIERMETSADAFVFKPFNPKTLLFKVEKLIEQKKTLKDKFSKSLNFEAKEMVLISADERLMQKAVNLVKDNISNPELTIEDLGSELGMSRVHTYRKIKALTNMTPSEFIRTIRIKQASYLLSQNKINISEVAYAVGFRSHQYFTKCFQDYFRMSPSDYSQRIYNESINVDVKSVNIA
jgi:YesN/AraC family two-component response regulator